MPGETFDPKWPQDARNLRMTKDKGRNVRRKASAKQVSNLGVTVSSPKRSGVGWLVVFFALVIGVNARCAGIAGDPVWEAPLRASLTEMVDHLNATLTAWEVPQAIFPVENFGAMADGITVNTVAIQKAIDGCSAAGGGTVLLSKGDYVTGTLILKNGVMLKVDAGSRLLGSTNLRDYPAKIPAERTIMDSYYQIKQSLIYAENCERIGVCGGGVIDGRGTQKNFPGKETNGAIVNRPFLIRIIGCRQVVMQDIQLRDSASWMEDYLNCDDLIIEGIKVDNQANFNNDGIDVDGCHNVIIRNCQINAEDDGLCFKGAGEREMENILVENCKIYSTCNALKFGTDSQGGCANVLVRNIEVGGLAPELRSFNKHRPAESGIAWETVDGGDVKNILVSDVHIIRAVSPIFLRRGDRDRVAPGTAKPPPGLLQHLIFERVTGDDLGPRCSIISGIPGAPVEDVIIQDVKISTKGGGKTMAGAIPEKAEVYPNPDMFGRDSRAYGFWLRHAHNIEISNVEITPQSRDERPDHILDSDTENISWNGQSLGAGN